MAESEDQNQTSRFIEKYRSFPLLWDANHKWYTNNIKRNDAIVAIGTTFNMDVAAVKSKIKSLRSYFSKERQKVLKKNLVPERNKIIFPHGLLITRCFLFLIQQHQGKLGIARK
ncbi:hypothetical protein QTP88_020810 [Uroleucon formosanum]